MPAATAKEPSYSLQSSFYGPGALWCWYLTFVSALIKSSLGLPPGPQQKPTVDILCLLLFPSLSGGHLVFQISQFDRDNAPKISDFIRLLSAGGIDTLRDHDDGADPTLNEIMAALNAPLRVCTLFVLAVTILLGVYVGSRVTAGKLRSSFRRSLLSSVILASYIWVGGCLGYFVFQCQQFGTSLTADVMALAARGVLLPCWVAGFILFSMVLGLIGEGFMELVRQRRSQNHQVRTRTLRSLAGLVMALAGIVTIAWLCRSSFLTFRFHYFPDVGVAVSELDQIFPILTGAICLSFSISEIVPPIQS